MNKENKIRFTIDGKECWAEEGQYMIEAARDNDVFIPSLCNMSGVIPAGSCRICNVRMNGRSVAACTTPISRDLENAVVENITPEIEKIRQTIIELLFAEGNHFCPSCEKGGSCELQALAYRYKVMVLQFEHRFPIREVDATSPKIFLDRNRCIFCKRCIRVFRDRNNHGLFAFYKRGHNLEIHIDHELAGNLTDEMAQKAMNTCPVGAILRKEKGYDVPIGQRKFDKVPIGLDSKIMK